MRSTVFVSACVVAGFLALARFDLGEARASYHGDCKATIAIEMVHKRVQTKHWPRVKVTFRLVKIHELKPHQHSPCTKYLNKKLVYWFNVPKPLVGKVKRGARLTALYQEMDGMTPEGVVSSKSWALMPPQPRRPKRHRP